MTPQSQGIPTIQTLKNQLDSLRKQVNQNKKAIQRISQLQTRINKLTSGVPVVNPQQGGRNKVVKQQSAGSAQGATQAGSVSAPAGSVSAPAVVQQKPAQAGGSVTALAVQQKPAQAGGSVTALAVQQKPAQAGQKQPAQAGQSIWGNVSDYLGISQLFQRAQNQAQKTAAQKAAAQKAAAQKAAAQQAAAQQAAAQKAAAQKAASVGANPIQSTATQQATKKIQQGVRQPITVQPTGTDANAFCRCDNSPGVKTQLNPLVTMTNKLDSFTQRLVKQEDDPLSWFKLPQDQKVKLGLNTMQKQKQAWQKLTNKIRDQTKTEIVKQLQNNQQYKKAPKKIKGRIETRQRTLKKLKKIKDLLDNQTLKAGNIYNNKVAFDEINNLLLLFLEDQSKQAKLDLLQKIVLQAGIKLQRADIQKIVNDMHMSGKGSTDQFKRRVKQKLSFPGSGISPPQIS